MIDAAHTLSINTPILSVWDYVKDMQKWASIFPGCRECTIINENDSEWIIKVGVGGLVRTVKVQVHVEQWAGPERVDFSFQLESEPVVGKGNYVASNKGQNETEVCLQVFVEGSGQMAPMWEAMCRPLLPQLAKTFANSLKTDIENIAGVAPPEKPSFFTRFATRLRSIWHSLLKIFINSLPDNTNDKKRSS